MTVQAAAGSTVLATAVGIGTAGGTSATTFAAQSVEMLAYTGASDTMVLVTMAMLLIFAGALLNGLSRRHGGLVPAGVSGSGPPLRT